MKKLLALLGAYLLGGMVFVSHALAQPATPDADQLFQQYRAAESRWSFSVSEAVHGRITDEDKNCGGVWLVGCKWLDEMFRLNDVLKSRADAGDANAMFYTALLKIERTENMGKAQSQRVAVQEYESAASYYKRAGDGGAIAGYWNVAQMYANGTGVIQSKSAAVEWFYKAGTAYLARGLREKALAALDAIKAIDIEHRLGKRLQTALTKGEPK